jgi:nucleoside phosphorylase
MSKVTPLGEYILAQLNLNSRTLKSLEIGGNRSHYRAAINWISNYQPQSDESKSQQVRNLLEAFHNLCEVGDLEKASKLFSMQIEHYVCEGLCVQLYIWGQYDELSATSLRLLELLNLNSKTNDQTFSLHIACLRNLGIIEFIRGNCEASIGYYNQQLHVSIQHEDFKGRASALIGLGQNSIFLGKYSEANKYYLSAQDIASKLSDQKLSMSAKSGLGNIQIKLGQYELAIPYFQEQLKIAEESPDSLGKIQALADLGNAYSLTGDHETAVESHLNALKVSHSIENPEGEAKILAHLGFAFYIQQEYRAAIAFYKQSLTISRSIGLFLEESESLEKVGVLEGRLSNSPTVKQLSLDKLRQALDRFSKAGSLSGEARVLKEMAELYDELGEMEPALKACQESLNIARDLRLPLQDECVKLEARLSNKKDSEKPSKIRTFREVDLNKLDWLKNEIDIVLLTATDIELNAVLDQLKLYPGRKEKFKIFEGPETYYVGRFGAFKAIATKCRMGAISEGSVILATEQAQRIWKPKAIIMVGIAFGKDAKKQKIGDVLVASQIISYEPQRVGEPVQHRGSIPSSNTTLLNRFENVHDWEFPSVDGSPCNLQIGPILSGEKLIDDPEFKSALLKQFPQAIGGEMEGAGLCAASGRVGIAWILVKSICDWADGTKNDEYHSLASAAAVSLVYKVLSQKTVLNSIRRVSE